MLPFLKISLGVLGTAALIGLPSSPASGAYRIEITPRLQIAEEYDDNVFLTKEDAQSDYITTLSPGIKISFDSPKNRAELDYSATWAAYQNHSRSDTWRHQAGLNLRHLSNEHLQFKLEEYYIKSEEPFEPDRNNLGFNQGRNTYQRNRIRGRMDYQFGREDDLAAGYTYETLRNDDPASADVSSYGPFAKLNYWFDKKNGMETGYQFQQYEFDPKNDSTSYADHRTHQADLRFIHLFNPRMRADIHYGLTDNDFTSALERDYHVHQADLGAKYDFSPHTSLELRGGLFQVSLDHETRFLGAAILRREINRGRISLQWRQGWDEDFLDLQTRGFTRFWDAEGRIQYALRKDLEAKLDISYRKNTYLFDIRPDDEMYQGHCGLAWKFQRWSTLGLDYSYLSRQSSDPQTTYTDNRMMLSITIARPFYPKSFYPNEN